MSPGNGPEPEREPFAAGPPSRLAAWLHGSSTRPRRFRLSAWQDTALSVVVTIGLGIWGFSRLPIHPRLDFLESVYHAIKLYTLDLGPAGGGSPRPNWQLWVALILAARLVLRALLALGRDRLRGLAVRRVLAGHVIVCGGGVHGAALIAALVKERRPDTMPSPTPDKPTPPPQPEVVLIDVDAASPGMQGVPAAREWRILGDAVVEETLLRAGIGRAQTIVVMTGNDFVNCQIVSAVRALAQRGKLSPRLHVLVQVEDASLARFLEEEADATTTGENSQALVLSPFSANAIAAQTLTEESEVKLDSGGRDSLVSMRGGSAPSVLLVGDHPLIDAVVLELLRRWRVRILREQERHSELQRPPLRVSIFGPEAAARVQRLRHRWQPEPPVLTLEGLDSEPSDDGAADIESWRRRTHEWLRKPGRADHAIVACIDELDGVKRTLELGRVLGDSVLITRVSAQSESVLDEHIRDRLEYTGVRSLAELACKPEQMAKIGAPDRLADALLREHPDPDAARWSAAKLFDRPELELHSDSTWRVRASEGPLLSALLHPVPPSALLRAGLTVNLGTPANLLTAARRLSMTGAAQAAFPAWCEYARTLDAGSLPALRAQVSRLSAPDWPAEDKHPTDNVESTEMGTSTDVRAGAELGAAVLRLRAFTLGDAGALPSPEPGHWIGTERVAILAGGSASLTRTNQELLEPLLERALIGYDGTILSGGTEPGLPGIVGRVAERLRLPAIGYVPANRGAPELYARLRKTKGTDFSVREPLAMWEDILGSGIGIEDVRVLVCAGGEISMQEILLGRALGATVAWIDPAGESERLEDRLPFGADAVLEPPSDPMTIRAFLIWSRLPEEISEPVAISLHNAYRRRQRARKRADDPSMAAWDDLLETLKASNRAQADDIPNKLRLLGRRIARPGERLRLEPEEIELLAEIEHGRFNIERLLAGWVLGERRIDRSVSPYLKPWIELDERARDYDREAVLNIDPALRELGLGVESR